MNRLAGSVVVLALLPAVSGCSGGRPAAGEALRDLGFTVFAPELDGAGPTETRIDTDRVVSQYPRYASLVQTAVPDGDLCDAVLVSREAGVECRLTDGVVHTSRDEKSGVGIVRNGTFLMWYSLITDVDSGLLDRAEQSLRDAPESDGDDLGSISTDEAAASQGPGSSIGSEPPPPEPAASAYTLFDPDLDDAEPVETTVYADYVSTTYTSGSSGFTLSQQPDPQRDLCVALARRRMAGDTCTVTDGVMVTKMEEFNGVALVRDGTLLFASSLLVEGNEGLVDRATTALQSAPETTLEDLGENSEGEELPELALPQVSPADFKVATAMAAVRHLAGTIGPREATSPAYDRAARWVGRRFERLGYSVRRQRIAVPAGNSWGVPVGAGRSVNVIATPPDFLPEEPHLVVGAHLDTVPQAPGAEDNASGVGVLLATAEAAAVSSTRLPVVFVAFGAEEPRSLTDPEQHHFGSRAYVEALAPGERDAVRGMISLDRVGVGARVPVGSANDTDPVQRQLLAAARRAGVPTTPDPDQRSSDHWSFVRAGLPGARLGSTPYVGYHSAQDVVAVVEPAQVERVGRLVLGWLAGR